MSDCCFIVTYMLMRNVGHIEKSSAAAFQGDKNPGIAAEVRGIHMHNSFARHHGLLPFEIHCGQQALDGRWTYTTLSTNLCYRLLTVKITIPHLFRSYFMTPSEAQTTYHTLIALGGFVRSVLTHIGGIA